MKEIGLHDFYCEADCLYDGERYSVRDNGSVLRHPRTGKRPRPTDNKWTFGKPNSQNGYMHIASVRIHRIVATAFHGEPPTPQHVVDHIDTNRRNNRPENLRWMTRLENALSNPITRKRIELICGSIEAFLEDPSRLGHSKLDRNFEWMRTVSVSEAQSCRERMNIWAKSDKPLSGGSLGEWVFKPIENQDCMSETTQGATDLIMAKTQGATQRKWRTPTEFPCCPQGSEENPIAAYAERLKAGAIFSRSDFSTIIVLDSGVAEDGQSAWVMCEQTQTDALKPWLLAQIAYEDELYVHTSFGTFFSKEGAEKQFCLALGLEWTGSDTFDDYC